MTVLRPRGSAGSGERPGAALGDSDEVTDPAGAVAAAGGTADPASRSALTAANDDGAKAPLTTTIMRKRSIHNTLAVVKSVGVNLDEIKAKAVGLMQITKRRKTSLIGNTFQRVASKSYAPNHFVRTGSEGNGGRPPMIGRQLRLFAVIAVISGFGILRGDAQDLRITIPRRSELTPVQRLNREGVEAVRKRQYEKAEAIFYKAYLYDPSDPFTLNNLGYISELQGQLDRAQRFYKLASEQGTDAFIARSNEKQLQGKRMSYALDNLKDMPMRLNRMNFDAIMLLSENRYFEAELLLQQALKLDPQNTFTLNNLGVAAESIGDYESALKYYKAAADSRSSELVVVTLKNSWRGKPVSEMAADNARQLQARMKTLNTSESRAAMLATRGVWALNQNDWTTARKDFLQAYSLDPDSAFSLNNAGYVAERDGDLETAQFFYQRARKAEDADARVGLATQISAEGSPLVSVATDNDQQAEGKIDEASQARHREKGPIELLHRNGTPVVTSKPPAQQPMSPNPAATTSPAPTPQPPQ